MGNEYMGNEYKGEIMKSPTMVKEMNFYDALKMVEAGSKVTKKEWNNPDIFIFLSDEKLSIKTEDKKVHPLIVSSGDMMGEDWEMV